MRRILEQFLVWRIKHISDKNFILLLSVVVGFLGGMSAVVIKNGVHLVQHLLTSGFSEEYHHLLYFAYPLIGIFIAVCYVKFIVRRNVGHGIPSVLYAISKNNGIISRHNIFSSIVTSIFTVGFGGSVGLEGPTVATGAAIGSSLGKSLHLSYKQITLLLGLASAAAMAAIFKSPIAAVIFAIEVIMIDLTTVSIVPLLIASVTALLTSYFFLGQAVLYPFEIHETFEAREFPYYIILGIFGGLVSVYFTRTYIYIEKLFGFIKSWYGKLLVGGICLGILIFFFPALYGEGYAAVNASLHGDISELFKNSILYPYRSSLLIVFLMMFVIILLKVIAASVTFGSGGIGGIFAPTLFTGAFTGLFIGKLINVLEIGAVSETNFALVGMCGLISGVLHAPLTAIFLIAEITSGYALFVPLMITAAFSYATTRIFVSNSVYTHQLARRGELITHHKDRAILSLMKVKDMLETNFHTVTIEANLGDLVKIVSRSKRNIFPVVEDDKTFRGMILMDDIRDIMFRPELYEKVRVRNLMIIPATIVNIDDTMEEVAQKFQKSGKYVLTVLADGKYMGFVSRANVFSEYRKMLHDFSDD